jgi:hypothetical protein
MDRDIEDQAAARAREGIDSFLEAAARPFGEIRIAGFAVPPTLTSRSPSRLSAYKGSVVVKMLAANSTFARSIDSAGWALFFIWAGTALLAKISWNWWLAGTAILILGAQAALLLGRERLDTFMLALGVVLLAGSIADMLGCAWSLVPALLIVIGLMMLSASLRSAAPKRERGQAG